MERLSYISNGVLYVDKNPVDNLPYLVQFSTYNGSCFAAVDINGDVWLLESDNNKEVHIKKSIKSKNAVYVYLYHYNWISIITKSGKLLNRIYDNSNIVKGFRKIDTKNTPDKVKKTKYNLISDKDGNRYLRKDNQYSLVEKKLYGRHVSGSVWDNDDTLWYDKTYNSDIIAKYENIDVNEITYSHYINHINQTRTLYILYKNKEFHIHHLDGTIEIIQDVDCIPNQSTYRGNTKSAKKLY